MKTRVAISLIITALFLMGCPPPSPGAHPHSAMDAQP